MDKVYSFKAKIQPGSLKSVIQSEQKLQFYSEEECDSQNDTPMSKTSKPTPQKSKFNQKNDYYTDDSDSGTPKNVNNNKNQTQKQSKFKTLVNTKQIEGDLENDPEFSEGDHCELKEEQKIQAQEYNIEEQAQKLQQKLKDNTKKNIKNKQSSSQATLAVNSDNEQMKKKQNTAQDLLKNHPFRHLIFGPNINDDSFKKYLQLTQRGLIYAKKCLKGPSDKFIKSKQVVLPEAKVFYNQVKKEKALVLDLDETLIHSCQPRDNPQVFVTAYGEQGEEAKIGINIRPYTTFFLSKMSQFYTIYIYTASSSAYANAILGYIDPQKEFVQGILTRNNCMETKNGFFIKDLRIISNKKLENMILVDNLAHSFGFQIENGIPILEWYNDQNDQELKYLADYLIEASKVDDVRTFNIQKLKLHELIEYNLEW